MNILYIGYWDIQDPLTTSTVIPHLKILSSMEEVKKLVFTNTQRLPIDKNAVEKIKDLGIYYEPIRSKNFKFNYLNKISDFLFFPRFLGELAHRYKVDFIVARSSPAGSLAYLVWRKAKIPFFVESYEPHADYMLESGVWNRYGLKYISQKKWEKRILRHAAGIIPVTENYRNKLIADGVDSGRIQTVPCAADSELFRFNFQKRKAVRNRLKIDKNTITGIYVGKFGGIYYEEEAYMIFNETFKHFNGDFFLIVLTDHNIDEVKRRLKHLNFPLEKCFVSKVPHSHVPDFLSASDFAFSTIKPSEHRLFCSPVKNGEYWANGLPILLTEGVGDDSNIIQSEGGGALFNLDREESLKNALYKIQGIIAIPQNRRIITSLALKYRATSFASDAYKYFLTKQY